MKKRLQTSIFIVAALIIAFASRELTLYIFDLLFGGLAVMACVEIARVMERFKKYTHISIAGSIPAVMYILTVVFIKKQLTWQYFVVGLLCILIFYFALVFALTVFMKKTTEKEMLKYGIKDITRAQYAYEKAFNTLFLVIYPSVLFMAIIMLNHFGELRSVVRLGVNTHMLALFVLLFAVITTVCTDTFAYLIGSSLRGPKLCPRISPNKTISGSVGGLFGSVVSALLLYLIFITNNNFVVAFGAIGGQVWHIVVMAILGSVVSQFGDLFASALKRHARVKDYGTIFPGHGGVMDRVDALIFNAFFVLIFLLILV